jgi:hypothetical protein
VNSLPRVVAPSVILRGVVATRGNSQCRWWGGYVKTACKCVRL